MDRIPEPERMDIPERADAYAFTDFSEVNAAFVARLLEFTAGMEAALALDLGTGPGAIPLHVGALRPRWRICAVDASLPMLRHGAAAAPGGRVDFMLGDAKCLPYPGGAFDLVFSNSLLHHLPDPLPFWREVRRVTRPGGFIFVRDLFRPPSFADAQRLVDTYAANEHPLLREDFYNSFLAAFTPSEIRAQLDEAHLGKLTIRESTDRHVDISGHAD